VSDGTASVRPAALPEVPGIKINGKIKEMANMRKLLSVVCIGVSVASGALSSAVQAEPASAYPSHPIHWVVPFPPGSGTDILTRIVAREVSNDWKQGVVVDNRPGAGTVIGTELVARAAPDGYMLLTASNNLAIAPALYAKLPFDPIKDFTAVSDLGVLPFLLVVAPTVPVKSVKELVDLAHAKPGQLNYASTGNGTPPHVAGELFKQMANLNMVHVPYKGSADALSALLSGSVQVMFVNTLSVSALVRAGKLHALAVGSPQRIAIMPEIPTVAESGYPGFDVRTWVGAVVPAGTSKDIVDKLNAELTHVLTLPQVKKAFADQGAELSPSTPEAFQRYIADEVVRLGAIVKSAHMHVD
jgi:tripartite-type tricarboxylate transporter receptor subunit TctC